MKQRLRLVVLISGQGSNLQAILDAIETKRLDATVCAVISNRPGAPGLLRAEQKNLPAITVDHAAFSDRESFEQELRRNIDLYQPDLIVLAGFMRKLGAKTVQQYAGKILNIHPSILPKYPGRDTHARVLAAGERQHGATVHVVTEEVDAGPVLGQAVLDIAPNDTPTSLQQRVHELEHVLYPEVLQRIAAGKIKP